MELDGGKRDGVILAVQDDAKTPAAAPAPSWTMTARSGESMRLAVEGLAGILDPRRQRADNSQTANITVPSVTPSNRDN